MSESDDPKPKSVLTPRTAALRVQREARLAAALRRNLKRRKDQSRGRTVEHDPADTPRGDREK